MNGRARGLSPSTLALAALIALIPWESRLGGLRLTLAWAAPLLLMGEIALDRLNEGRRLVWKSPLAVAAAMLLLGAVCLGLRAADGGFGRNLATLVGRSAPYLILYSFLHAWTADARPGDQLDRWLRRALAAWGVWMFLSSSLSLHPRVSFELLAKEGGPYLLVCATAAFAWARSGPEARLGLRAMIFVGAVVGVIGVAVLCLAYFGTSGMEDFFAHHAWIRGGRGPHGERIVRLQYPFEEHNRLASYLLAAAMLVPAAIALERRARTKALLAAAAMAMLGAMIFTGTRGGVLAAVAGLGVFSLARPRFPIAIAVVCGLIVALAPSGMPKHLRSILRGDTYSDPQGNVQLRVRAWRGAARIISERPLLGLGYGWENFEKEYKARREEFNDIQNKPHAHNNFLEIAAETGLPGLAIFLAYQAGLVAGIVALLRRSERRTTARALALALLAALVALHAFGMTNYSLRRTVGYEVWLAFAMVQALLSLALRGELGDGAADAEAPTGEPTNPAPPPAPQSNSAGIS